MQEEAFVGTVVAVTLLLFVAAVSALIMKRLRFPYTVGLVLVGVGLAFLGERWEPLGDTLDRLEFGPLIILFVFIPILIFESAFNTDGRLLVRNLAPTLVLAGPGLLISTAIIGGLVHLLTPLPLGSALIFGCLISATDPVAVIALFRDVGAPKRLTTLVEGESVLNDATAIVTFQIILGVMATGLLDAGILAEGLGQFAYVFSVGLVVGLAFGYLLVQAAPLIGDEGLVHIALTLVAAYGSFLVSEHLLHASGIMAVLGAGIVLGYHGPTIYSPHARSELALFWENGSFVANSLIFLLLGVSEKVFLTNVGGNLQGLLVPVVLVIGIVVLARAVVVFTLLPLVNRLSSGRPVDLRYRAVMYWGGLRGAIAIALAISLPSHFPFRWQIIDFTFGVTLFMLLVNGTTMSWLIRRLGLHEPGLLEDLLATHARLRAKRSALAQLDEQARRVGAAGDLVARLHREKAADLAAEEARLAQLRRRVGVDRATRRKLLWLHALAIQAQVYRQRYESGQLNRAGLRRLEGTMHQAEARLRQVDFEVGDQLGGGAERTVVGIPPDVTRLSAAEDVLLESGPLEALRSREATGLLDRLRSILPARAPELAEIRDEAAAMVAASLTVRSALGDCADFAGADPADIEACRAHFIQLERQAEAHLNAAEAADAEQLHHRHLQRVARDFEAREYERLRVSDSLPERLAEELERALESGGAG